VIGGKLAPACRVCESRAVRPLCVKGPATYYLCRGCDTVFQYPLPSAEEMIRYADTQYREGVYQDYVRAREMKHQHFRARLGEFATRFPPPGRLLDLGCSCGYFLDVALERGYDAYGVEFSEEAIAAAQPATRQRIRRANVNDAGGDHPHEYDVVTAFDIVEHVEDPIAFLVEIAGMLVPGGGVVLSTPDTGHVLRYVMGARWPMLQPMQHTTLMSRLGLRMALERAGFQQVVVTTARKTLTLEYLVEQLRDHNPALHAAYAMTRRIVPGAVRTHALRINIGEQMAVAVKPRW
jgi:2-polyprenyl-3-methyl-5-hydroxy-6-metoxy-1,4-benzoquinol methylase